MACLRALPQSTPRHVTRSVRCAVACAVADVCAYGFYSIQPAFRRLQNWATAYAQVSPPPPPAAAFMGCAAPSRLNCETMHAWVPCMQAYAAAYVQCQSYVGGAGQAKGCAWASAESDAFSVAYAEAHAVAAAQAFASSCVCENAEAWAFGRADLVLQLLAGGARGGASLACGPGHPELSKSYMDMASKLFTFTFTFTRVRMRFRHAPPAAANRRAARMLSDQCLVARERLASGMNLQPGWVGRQRRGCGGSAPLMR